MYRPNLLNYRYRLHKGTFRYENEGGDISYVCDQIAFAYDAQSFTMLKHGAPEDVSKYVERCSRKGIAIAGFDIGMITVSKDVPVEEINRVLDCAGYMCAFIEKWGKQSHE